MRSLALSALITAAALLPGSIAIALSERSQSHTAEVRLLARGAADEASRLISFFEKARAVALLTGRDPAFADAVTAGARRRDLRGVVSALKVVGTMFPGGVAEASFANAAGREIARVVDGEAVPPGALAGDTSRRPYFGPAMASPPSEAYQAEPYVSGSTGERVIPTAVPIMDARGTRLGLLHFELSMATFRDEMVHSAHGTRLVVVDAIGGQTVIDTAPASTVPVPLPATGESAGYEIGGHVAASREMPFLAGNANRWVVVAVSEHARPGIVSSLGPVSWAMLGLAAALALLAFLGLRASNRELDRQANHDALTGLPNRRRLLADLRRVTGRHEPATLMLLDLNGFKGYNDNFGHLAGDALLTRLGKTLRDAVAPWGYAYRLGGDEFCVLAHDVRRGVLEGAAAAALVEQGDGFAVSACFGTVDLPGEAFTAEEALLLADQRMYRQKAGGRPTARGQTQAVLLQALVERHPTLHDHSGDVAELAEAIASEIGLEGAEIENVRVGAELHDVGKVAIPEAIINKPGPLDDAEWSFMHRHTIIGERILLAAPALAHVAPMVRSSHERWDGGGYPDGLAGESIPLGARIIAVCDSFDAMVSQRPYAPSRSVDTALTELRRCAGTQFDEMVVAAFDRVWAARAADAARAATQELVGAA